MGLGRRIALVAGVAAASTAATAQPQQKVTGPVAVYWMSAQTQTGFGMPTAGGAAPNPMAMMRQMMGGGGGANKSLTLQLGSSQTSAAPAADHLPPQGLQAGAALPLPAGWPLSELRIPALGAPGCGIATAVAMWAQAIVALLLLWRDPFYRPFELAAAGQREHSHARLHQQPRRVAGLDRRLRDQPLGQLVVQLVGLHAFSPARSTAPATPHRPRVRRAPAPRRLPAR